MQYMCMHYGEDLTYPLLYDVLLNSRHSIEASAKLVLQAIETLQ